MRKKTTQFLAYSLFALVVLPVSMAAYIGQDIGSGQKITASETISIDKDEPAEDKSKPAPANPDNAEEFIDTEPSQAVMAAVSDIDLDKLEDYIVCVVAAEMPALFNDEALKAQAVAARTYAVNQMHANSFSLEDMIAFGGQAYIDTQGMKTKWGSNYEKYHNKIKADVDATRGEIMVYDGEPILAVFHAISRGKTEDAENVWKQDIPYLKSVDSEGDTDAAEYTFKTSIKSSEIISLLEAKFGSFNVAGDLADSMSVTDRSPAGYINSIKIGDKSFTGRQVREALGLRSTDFTFEKNGDNIVFTTKGYGHGAGMSQYGAHYLGEEGKDYKEILSHYYTGISFTKIK